MIDDQKQVKVLMQQMEAALPIPATLTTGLVRTLREKGKPLRKREVFIQQVFYLGDEAGISCDITPPQFQVAKEHIVVSLTRLRISPKHPLGAEIRAYQQARIKKLAAQTE